MNFIEELFYGNIRPSKQSFSRHSPYGKAMDTLVKSENILTDELTGHLKHTFLDFSNAQLQIVSITARENFLNGFVLGAHFMQDTFLTDHDRMLQDIS